MKIVVVLPKKKIKEYLKKLDNSAEYDGSDDSYWLEWDGKIDEMYLEDDGTLIIRHSSKMEESGAPSLFLDIPFDEMLEQFVQFNFFTEFNEYLKKLNKQHKSIKLSFGKINKELEKMLEKNNVVE